MGMADRNYGQRGTWAPAGLGQLTPVVKWLIIINVAVFFGDSVLFRNRLGNWGCFTIESAIDNARIWEFFTFQFLFQIFNSYILFIYLFNLIYQVFKVYFVKRKL